ncbi:hypothetical protein CAPTEDRAFT_171517 [Capitella teleta]|uniref:2-hydroxyacyl-CoA lyase 2 n=1 Tax=Capitella teleta TaxID=283909 RepID=R7USA6_CAPTE|nr:hypothetical protein CAPTEDRAFT_171517 [Capitella teleta]|eukprot:ELU06807.1 hypothetical protein CAPTEDRAFT_171517 [Capitella teleta]
MIDSGSILSCLDGCLPCAVGIGVVSFTLLLIGVLNKIGILYQMTHKVDPTSKKHGGQIVADVLKAHGIKFVFTLPGGHISPILVAAEKLGIRIVDTRHEATAVFAADAVARMSGTVGVAAVTAGPGLTNTVTAVKNAQMAETPVLLMGGAAASLLKGRGALQDIDQMSLFKPLCKFTATITRIRDIAPIVRKALQEAVSGTPGPVFIEFPIDTLYEYSVVSKEMGMSGQGKGLMQKIVNWYLQNYLANLFAGAWEPRETSPLPVNIPMPSNHQVQRSAELISKAKRPLILLGSQSTLPPMPVDELRSALETIGIPCFLGGMARGLLGRKSALQMRQQRRDALKEADVVILAGSVCDFRLGYGRTLSRKSKIISVNRNKDQLYKNSDMFWKPTQAIQADVGSFIQSLLPLLRGYKCDPGWVATLRARDDAKEKKNLEMTSQPTDQHLNPVKLLHVLEDILPDNAILVADGGDFVATAAYILRPRGPLRWLDPGAFGTLGVGGGFALGAKLCRPESEVWIVYGDGSLGYSAAEFDTFTRHKTPVIALIGNDACWMQIAREQLPMLGSDVACRLAFLQFSEYERVARGYGGMGVRMDRSNEAQMKEILEEAQKQSAAGNSYLINCLIGKTSFREGSISV